MSTEKLSVRVKRWILARIAAGLAFIAGPRLGLIRLPLRVHHPMLRAKLQQYYAWELALRRPTRLVASIRNGRLMELDTTDMLQRVLAVSGTWEPNITAVVERLVVAGDTFVDVGANVGYYTLLASSLVGARGAIFAFEPAAAIYETLCRNLRLNHLDDVHACRIAVGQVSGATTVHLAPPANLGATRVDSLHGHIPESWQAEPALVRVESLTRLLEDADAGRPMVVKIDVEGLEPEVLGGFESALGAGLPDLAILVECSPEWWTGNKRAWFQRFVARNSFGAFRVHNHYSVEAFFPTELEDPVELTAIPETQFDALLVRGTVMRARFERAFPH